MGSNEVKNLCRNRKLNQVAQKSGLVEYVVKNPCQQGQVPQATAASTVEALVGAVYLDSGKNMEIIRKMLEAIEVFEAT